MGNAERGEERKGEEGERGKKGGNLRHGRLHVSVPLCVCGDSGIVPSLPPSPSLSLSRPFVGRLSHACSVTQRQNGSRYRRIGTKNAWSSPTNAWMDGKEEDFVL